MRPPTHTPEAITQDIMRLSRVLRRVQSSTRSQARKDELTMLINETISLLTSGEDEISPSKKKAKK